jgi:signal transduction histidine kinase
VEVTTSLLREEGRPRSIQGIARDISDRLLAESALRHLNARLEEKAKQIAHALHDEAGQLLASVYLKVAELERTPSKRARTRFQELRGLLDEVDREIRHLAYELRPAILDDLGLIPALGFLAEGVSKRNHIRVDVIGTTDGRVSNDVETAIYRVVQEALTNAARHGHPTAVRVELSRSPRLLAGRVIDDGAGFEPKAVLGRTSTSLGLIGMRERIAALGGTLAVTSTPGQGTTVQFEVPIEERDAHVSTTRR